MNLKYFFALLPARICARIPARAGFDDKIYWILQSRKRPLFGTLVVLGSRREVGAD